MIKYMLNY